MKQRIALAGALGAVWLLAAFQNDPSSAETKWWRGNTHTHTLWSDGDGAPELVSKWYVDNGYHFLVLSDHNVLSEGDKWFPVAEDGRLTEARLSELVREFGEENVHVRTAGAATEMRLATLAELRGRYEKKGEFLFVKGEEITDAFDRLPVHVNAMNLGELIPPQGGDSVVDTANRNIDAVIEQGKRLGRPVLAHLNHPNFGWAFTASQLAQIRGERFFEVHNGHTGVRNYGDEQHASLEEMWDIALVQRLTKLDLGLLYGIATDDSHNYHQVGPAYHNSGRGWVMVRAPELTPEAIVDAMQAGDFYATTGVVLDEILIDDDGMTIDIAAEEGVVYVTMFIGTRVDAEGNMASTGELLQTSTEEVATYEFQGDELYVRARVVSTKDHPNPYHVGDKETAWVQPVRPK